MKRKPIYTLLFLLVFLGVTSLAFAEEYTFTNMDGITINDNAAATPYPSEITIPDNTIPGNVTDVTVTLYHLTHTNPDDIRVLLDVAACEDVFPPPDPLGNRSSVPLRCGADEVDQAVPQGLIGLLVRTDERLVDLDPAERCAAAHLGDPRGALGSVDRIR